MTSIKLYYLVPKARSQMNDIKELTGCDVGFFSSELHFWDLKIFRSSATEADGFIISLASDRKKNAGN